MADNEITREMTFSEELPYFKEQMQEVFNNYHNPSGSEDPLHIAVLHRSSRIVRKAEEEINRQQAEIERLKKDILIARDAYTMLQTKNEIVKSEAVKEFAEKLENEINRRTTLSREQDKNVIHTIHDLLKEMVDEKISQPENSVSYVASTPFPQQNEEDKNETITF